MEIPAKIGKYTVMQKLGEGASGCVVKAEQDIIHRIVAMKILFPALTQRNPLIIKRFKREARLAACLLHPGIVPIFEIDEYKIDKDKGFHYYTMQYIRGIPMLDQVKNDSLTFDNRLNILIELCDAIALAHSKNIVHRDLKPHNVIITQEGHPVILDFGIAKSLQDEEQVTLVGNILGSAHYMAPEQAMTEKIGTFTDVFALGVMMYEFMTGERPFQGANVKELVQKRIEYTKNPEAYLPPSMQALKPDIPEEFDEIVFRCIAAYPKDRYQTAGELLSALQDFLKRKESNKTSPPTTKLVRTTKKLKLQVNKFKSYFMPLLLGIFLFVSIISAGIGVMKSNSPQLVPIQEFQKEISQKLALIIEQIKNIQKK